MSAEAKTKKFRLIDAVLAAVCVILVVESAALGTAYAGKGCLSIM